MKITDLFINHNNNNLTKVHYPYIIAEAGVNHECSMDLAKRLICEAKEGGAHAIKFQTYKAETLASKNSPSYWDTTKESTTSQFQLFQRYDKFWKNEYEVLKTICDDEGIEFLSTPFDIESANFLNDLMPAFKISSSDITNNPFIEHLCSFNKPIILSTGASYTWEVQRTVELINKQGNDLSLLHCVLNYPTDDVNAHLGMITDLQKNFPEYMIGYSDHTLPGDMDNLLYATMLGSSILEKHFTHDKSLPGNDHYHSMDINDLKTFCKKLEHMLSVMGSFSKHAIESEEISRKNARRSLIANVDIKKGQTITKDMLTFKRPAFGISPSEINNVIGKTTNSDLNKDDILKWEHLK